MLTWTLACLAAGGDDVGGFLPKPIYAYELNELLDRSLFVFRGTVAAAETEVILHPVRSGKIGVAVVDIEEMFVGEVASGRVRLNIVASGLGDLEASHLAPGDEILAFATYRRGTCAWDCEAYEPVEGEGPMVPLSDSLVPGVESWVVARRGDGIGGARPEAVFCYQANGRLRGLPSDDDGTVLQDEAGRPILRDECVGQDWFGWLPIVRASAEGRSGGSIPGGVR